LAHRGSEPAELAERDGLALGALGHDGPALASRDGWTVAGDVELYNRRELLDELNPSDDAASTDVGLILEAWKRWGVDALGRLNADFAIAVHEEADGTLILARDACGARPLYWAHREGGIAFASEYKALVALRDFPREVDREALQSLQSRKLLPDGYTLLRDVRQLSAGSWARVEPGTDVRPRRYWDVTVDLQDRSLADHAAAIRERFVVAMDRRTTGAGAIGISLSGGVDSMAMVAAARRSHPDAEILTFSAGDRDGDPELEWAARTAERFDTQHEALIVEPAALLTDLPRLVWHLEDPIARTETLLYARTAAAAASSGVTRLLGGHAADGIFGGMPRHKVLAVAGAVPPARRTLGEVYSFLQTGVRPRGLLARTMTRFALEPKIPPVPRVPGARPASSMAVPRRAGRELLNDALRTATLDGLPLWLPKVDRGHAAGGTRWASPFLDPELIREAFRVPSRYKRTLKRNKIVLREAVLALLPVELARRPKFAQRITETPAFCDALEQVATPLLAPDAVRERGLLESGDVERLMQRPAGGAWPPEHAMRIWTMALTELWARIFLDDGGARPAS
jgi:asparagine synthase (glutamine-hydrolysing)